MNYSGLPLAPFVPVKLGIFGITPLTGSGELRGSWAMTTAQAVFGGIFSGIRHRMTYIFMEFQSFPSLCRSHAAMFSRSTSPMNDSVLERIVARSQELYTLPAVAANVLELCQHEPVDLRRLKHILELDPALTGKILRVANSAYYGVRGDVTNLAQALNLLGVKLVKTLVVTFNLPENLVRDTQAEVLERFWRKTVYRSLVARRLAGLLDASNSETIYIAALLYDIGVLALVQELGEPYLQFMQHVSSEGAELHEQEQAVLGFRHAELSARILAHWGLPEGLLRVIAANQDNQAALTSGEREQVAILEIANLAAEFLVSSQPSALLRTLAAASKWRESAREQVRNWMVELETEVLAQATLFSFTPPAVGSIEQALQAAEAIISATGSNNEPHSANTQPETNLLEVVDGLRQELQNITRVMRVKHPVIKLPLEQRPAVPLRTLARECPRFTSQVRAAVGRCRSQRCAVSLVLVGIDQVENSPAIASETFAKITGWLRRVCVWETQMEERVVPLGEHCFGVMLDDCERSDAVDTARRMLERTRKRFTSVSDQLRVSAGVATLALPPRNFPERELIEVAVRCLLGAQVSGGGTVKSFEL
jgi:HD-like signal output (HDOD) protein